MVPSKPLAQLRDIHLPTPIGWWPMAPGWWLLLALAILILGSGLYYLWRCYQAAKARKQALQLLRIYEQQAEKEANSAQLCAKISELLRRVALAYYPRQQVAALRGQEWIAFLNANGRKVNFNAVQDLLLEKAYKARSQDNLKPLFSRARIWIKQRRRPC